MAEHFQGPELRPMVRREPLWGPDRQLCRGLLSHGRGRHWRGCQREPAGVGQTADTEAGSGYPVVLGGAGRLWGVKKVLLREFE